MVRILKIYLNIAYKVTLSTTYFDGKPRSNTYAKTCKKLKQCLLSQLQHIINIDARKIFDNAHIKPHIDYASVVCDGCGEVHLKY